MLEKLNINVKIFRFIDNLYLNIIDLFTPVKLFIILALIITIIIISSKIFSIIFCITLFILCMILNRLVRIWAQYVLTLSTNDCLPVFLTSVDINKGVALMNEYRSYYIATNNLLKKELLNESVNQEKINQLIVAKKKFKDYYLKEYRLYICWKLLGCIMLSVCESKESFGLFLEKYKSGEIR